jgi:hypothetical protein
VDNLVRLMDIKHQAAALGLTSVGFNRSQLTLGVGADGPLTPGSLAAFVGGSGGGYRLTPEGQLLRRVTPEQWERGLDTLSEALRELEKAVSSQTSRRRV